MTKDQIITVITAYQTLINDYVNITEEQLELIQKALNNQTL